MSITVLEQISKRFIEDTSLSPWVALEIEFYLASEDKALGDQLLALLYVAAKKENLDITKLERETGAGQFEVVLAHSPDAVKVADQLIRVKEIIRNIAINLGTEALFSAKPFPEQPGSGLHVHVSLHDSLGKNLFIKQNGHEESQTMLYAIGGLCDAMEESFLIFAPHSDSYKRFTHQRNKNIPEDVPMREHNHAPVNISWGGNNRTTAIRIPASTLYPNQRHIEHRVAGADADPHSVIAAILEGMKRGLLQKILPDEKLYGNAFDAQYARKPFPKTLEEARTLYHKGAIAQVLSSAAN